MGMSKKRLISPEQLAECEAAHAIFLRKKKELGLTQKAIADEAGISPPAVAFYFKGVNALNARFASVLARLLEVPVSAFSPRLAKEIADLSGSHKEQSPKEGSNVVTLRPKVRHENGELSIPVFNVRAAMGHGQVPAEYIEAVRNINLHESHLMGRGVSFTKAENLAVITGFGQSMEGTINDGDPVIIDRGVQSFIGDGVYVLTWSDLLYIKRLQRSSATHIDMISDNQLHRDKTVPGEEITIHARVLLVWNARKV